MLASANATIRSVFRDEETAERCGRWLQAAIFNHAPARAWCNERQISFTRAQGESSNSPGGFLVPQDFEAAVISLAERYGIARRYCRLIGMKADVKTVARRTGTATTYWPQEGATLTETSITWDGLQLVARKLAAMVRLSNELDEDAAGLAVDLADEFARAMAQTEDNVVFNGDGTSTYARMRGLNFLALDGNHGAMKSTAANGHNTFLTVDATDLASLIGTPLGRAAPGAAFYVSALGYAQTFCRIAGTAGGLSASVGPDGEINANYLGFPVRLAQALPNVSTTLAGKPMMAFGDLRAGAILGNARELIIAKSLTGPGFAADQALVRATERIAVEVHDLGDNSTPGAMAVLIGGA